MPEKYIDPHTGERIVPGKPEACAGNVERGGHSCDECDYFLFCFPDCDPDFRDDRHEAFRHALFETYPNTLNPEAEQVFLSAFQGYFGTENTEDLEWAKRKLHHLRENGFTNEEIDRIADLATAECEEEDEEIHGPFDTVAELMEALNSDDDDEKIDRVADEILHKYRRAFEELAK